MSTAAEIIINQFLKDVDECETMPWQRPYERYNSFNYFTMKTYRGINRLILPFGEYITKNQINKYNKDHNEDYRFVKGIKWYPVVFFTHVNKDITIEELLKVFPDCDTKVQGFIGSDAIWTYYIGDDGKAKKARNVLKFFEVADRQFFKNSKGETLPSRIKTGEVQIDLEDPKKVIDDYVERSGVDVCWDSIDTPCYLPYTDMVCLNPHMKSQEEWFSTAFHEFAHSTGAAKRLNRRGIAKPKGISNAEVKNLYAEEECIAEITACLLCAECGISTMSTSCSSVYANNLAYVQHWKKKVQEWGKSFIYIVSKADEAFNYILGDTEDKNR